MLFALLNDKRNFKNQAPSHVYKNFASPRPSHNGNSKTLPIGITISQPFLVFFMDSQTNVANQPRIPIFQGFKPNDS
jgi:hypothetical protein